MSMKRQINWGECLVPGLATFFGIAYFLQTRDASLDVMRWPYAVAGIAGVLLVLILCVFLLKPASSAVTKPSRKALLLLIVPVLYIVTMPYLGFALGSLIFLCTLFRLLGGDCWWRNLLVALIITTILYVATILLMDMSLPRLDLGFITL